MIDYALLSPEINSGRLYAGPGSTPMMTVASAWRGLAAEISSALTSCETTITQLVDEEWMGPASASMTAATKPYLAWMADTAAKAEEAATQATAAAAAFEAAHAATPPPAVIAANRAQQKQLVATNVVGQNSAAIMASDAQYFEMWAQATDVMYSYAASSAAATKVTPFSEPNQTTNPDGTANQAAAVSQANGTAASNNAAQTAQAISSLPNTLQTLTSPGPADAGLPPPTLAGLLEAIGRNASINGVVSLVTYPLNGVMSFTGTSAAFTPASLIPTMTTFFSGGGFNALGGGAAGAGIGALLAPGGPLSSLGALGGGAASAFAASAPTVTAGVGQATLVGELSAPSAWAAAAPAASAVDTASALQGSSWAAAPEQIESMAAMPGGMPMGAERGGFGLGTPRYGFKPTVMARPVVAG
ncbi:PPE family protein PPE31 [Mycolicibacter heraklionensis]|uniref:PPE family protein n=1 Tax=Mycolicibacter heraklionensis TaxID=512402 RepID=A0A9X7WJG5_9MYCO|nr:PPE family protein [Mycolicibacter heraklionensis]KLO31509.1 PPE family protein PPE31 [Mycolicibacter heraklionensis]QZA08757.1 PPE family protein [Mycolicibacter heraklionensis]